MARITLSGVITDINGSIGGWTFQNSLQGKTVRNKPIMTKQPTVKQSLNRPFPSFVRKAWSTLSGSEQADWNTYAAVNMFVDVYGNPKTLSGYQYFYSCYINSMVYGNGGNLLAPAGGELPVAMPSFTLSLSSSHITITPSIPIASPTQRIVIFGTLPTQQSSSFNRRLFFYFFTDAAVIAVSKNVTGEYEAITGLNWTNTYSSGKFYLHCFAYIVVADNGLFLAAQRATASNF